MVILVRVLLACMLSHVSASQVQTYRDCPRLWYLQKVLGQKTPEKGSQTTGKEIHAHMEAYVETGWVPPTTDEHYAKVVDAIKYVPRQPGQLVEYPIEFPAYQGGPTVVGYIDLLDPTTNGVTILDYKTTKDFKWAKTPSELAENVQLLTYAYFLYHAHEFPVWFSLPPVPPWTTWYDGSLKAVTTKHLYIKTTGTQRKGSTHAVSMPVTRSHVDRQWAGIVGDIKTMEALGASGLPALDVPGCASMCQAYGGCHFRNVCPEATQAPTVTLRSMFTPRKTETDMDDVMKRIKERAMKNAKTAGIVPPDAAPRETPNPRPETVPVLIVPAPSTGCSLKRLYVDCQPAVGRDVGVTVLSYDKWMAETLDLLHGTLGKAHYRFVEFGKGPGALSSLIKQRVDTLPEAMVVDSRRPEAQEFLAVVMALVPDAVVPR